VEEEYYWVKPHGVLLIESRIGAVSLKSLARLGCEWLATGAEVAAPAPHRKPHDRSAAARARLAQLMGNLEMELG